MTSSPIDPPPSSSTAPPSASYCPSVPIFLYRELAEELRETQTQLNFLKAQNRQLLQQNQQLRQEAANILDSTRKLEQAIAGERTDPSAPKSLRKQPSVQGLSAQKSEFFAIHSARDYSSESVSRSLIGSWRLVAIFSIIALFAFGIGFLTAPSLMKWVKGSSR